MRLIRDVDLGKGAGPSAFLSLGGLTEAAVRLLGVVAVRSNRPGTFNC